MRSQQLSASICGAVVQTEAQACSMPHQGGVHTLSFPTRRSADNPHTTHCGAHSLQDTSCSLILTRSQQRKQLALASLTSRVTCEATRVAPGFPSSHSVPFLQPCSAPQGPQRAVRSTCSRRAGKPGPHESRAWNFTFMTPSQPGGPGRPRQCSRLTCQKSHVTLSLCPVSALV